MTPRSHKRRPSRTIVLPTGKAVEVHYFSSDASPVRPPADEVDLDRCPECASDVVYPIAWNDAGDRTYELTLRCPNCEWTEVDMHDWDTVLRLEERLERRERALIADLQALSRANVEEDFDRFIAALRADQVWPMDF
jgi:hypothetical protein